MHRTLTLALAAGLLVTSTGGSVLAQSAPPASPAPSPEASAAPSEPPADARARIPSFRSPTWTRLSPGRTPPAREDHTWTVDAEGSAAYLFGGRDGRREFDDLWRYDLATDTWTKLSPRGATPGARFGHSAVWVEDVGLVVFAGQQGVDFFGDLWAYDPGSDRWRLLPANGGAPRARYGSCAIVGRDGRLWISHGFTFAGRFDDTRAYNFRNERWASIAPDGRRPGERCLHDCFTSADGALVLYGGQDDSRRALGDLWVTRRNGSWRKVASPNARPRRLYAVTEAGPNAFIFGGAGRDDAVLDDLWRVDRETLRFRRVRVSGPTPPGRSAATLITDAARGRLLLFGGESGTARDDLWQLTDEAAEDGDGGDGEVPVDEEAPDASPAAPDGADDAAGEVVDDEAPAAG